MPTYNLPPGAWLSGQGAVWTRSAGGRSPANQPDPYPRGGFMPVPPWQPALMPVPPTVGHMPVPPARTHWMPEWMPEPPQVAQMPEWMPEWLARGQNQANPLIRPWAGIDPDWVYTSGPEALLAQGLRRTRSKIAPALDPRRPAVPPGKVLPGSTGLPLWRWQRAYRVKAVVAEVLGRLVVQGTNLWWVAPPASAQSRSTPCQRIYSLPDLAGYDWSEQIDKVMRAAVEREERLPEILSQSADIAAYFDAVSGVDRDNAPRLSELLEVGWDVATHVVMALKNAAAVWRPFQLSSAIQPVIATPGHGSLPSGHATIAALTACLYAQLLPTPSPGRLDQLDRLARRIAFNRVVAGVHFPIDSEVGYALGAQIVLAMAAGVAGAAQPGVFQPGKSAAAGLNEITKPGSFSAPGAVRTIAAAAVKTAIAATKASKGTAKNAPPQAPPATPQLAALWLAAAEEMSRLTA